MQSGVAIFPTPETLHPAEIARIIEQRGYRHLMFPEHTHIPASRLTPHPSGRQLPRKYVRTHDLFVSVTAALSATSHVRVGSGICLLIERDPIITAKEVASVDHLSGGRFDFGIGAGWNREEMENHGTDPKRRFAVMAERIAAMKAIWTQEEASFSGEHVSFERIWSWPKPLQRPHPPILVGGNGATVLDRVLAYGDAWMPNHDRGGVLEGIAELRNRAADVGREIPVIVMGAPPEPSVLDAYANAGVQRVMFWLPSCGRVVIEQRLERIEKAMSEVLGGS